LEKQTKESIALLKKLKCPFIVALNKVDKLYGWEKHDNMDIQQTLNKQKDYVKNEYDTRVLEIKSQLSHEGFNSELYYKNDDSKKVISIVPLSARTGEGITDLILLKVKLVQEFMENKISYKDELKCSIMEVKPVHGFGMTIDVILVNGILKQGDKIILSGFNGPIVTKIKYLLTPQPLKDLRVKNEYINHETIKASQCIKISADNLEEVVPGTTLYVSNSEEETELFKKEASKEVNTFINKVAKDKIGITIQSSTIGSLEALITLLEEKKVPIGNIALGPLHKKHIMHSTMMKQKNPKYACILAFDVEVTNDAKNLADKENIKIYSSKIIYHLANNLDQYINDYNLVIKEKNKSIAIFPVSLKILCCFRAKDPLVIGCKVEEGQLRIGTPLQIRTQEGISIGKVIGIQIENKDIVIGKKGMELAVKFEGKTNLKFHDEIGEEKEREQHIMYGRHINENDVLCSKISRKSIDALKESFRDDMTDEDWQLIIELKNEQNIK
jgi:translation initiation factor 5B